MGNLLKLKILHYSFVTLVVALALFFQVLLEPYVPVINFLLLYPTIFLVAFLFGFFPAMYAILFSILGVNFLFVPPKGSFSIESADQVIQISVFVIMNFFMALILSKKKKNDEKLQSALIEAKNMKYALNTSSIVAMTDNRGIITYVNDKFCEISKYDASELIGQNHRILNSGVHSKSFFENLWKTISSGRVWRGEICNRAKDNSYYWVDTVIVPLMDSKNRPQQYIAIRNDITIKKQQEIQIRESEARFRQILESMPQIVWTTDSRGQAVYFNTQWAEYTGHDPAKSIEEGWIQTVHPEDKEQVIDNWKKSLLTGSLYTAEYRMRRRDGVYRWKLGRAAPVRNSRGQIVQWFGTSTDIEEQKRTQQEFKDALKIRENFLSIASHELKTPLTSLKLQTQISQRKYKSLDDEDLIPLKNVRNFLDQTSKQVERLVRLVDDMLDISKIARGQLGTNLEEFNLSDLLFDIIERFSPMFIQADCTLKINVKKDLWGKWDKFRIEQVIVNLLTNATRYGAGGEIEIEAFANSENVEIRIKDQGRGIDKADQDRIFERFERAISPYEVSGLGLGLYIVNYIVNSHQGEIRVESELGKGATFIVILPNNLKYSQVEH